VTVSKVVSLLSSYDHSEFQDFRQRLDKSESDRAISIIEKTCEKVVCGKVKSAVDYAVSYMDEWVFLDSELPHSNSGRLSDLIIRMDEVIECIKDKKSYRKVKREEQKTAQPDCDLLSVLSMFIHGLAVETEYQELSTELHRWSQEFLNVKNQIQTRI